MKEGLVYVEIKNLYLKVLLYKSKVEWDPILTNMSHH